MRVPSDRLSRQVLSILALVASTTAIGARTVTVAVVPHPTAADFSGGGAYLQIYCNVFNPSTQTQTLTATWHQTGTPVGWGTTNTATATSTTPLVTLAPEHSHLFVSAIGNPGSYAPQAYPRAISFTVNEDDGHLVGNCFVHYRSSNASGAMGHNSLPINGGRPF